MEFIKREIANTELSNWRVRIAGCWVQIKFLSKALSHWNYAHAVACKTQNILQTMIKISIIGFEIAIRLCIQRHTQAHRHTVLVENRSEKNAHESDIFYQSTQYGVFDMDMWWAWRCIWSTYKQPYTHFLMNWNTNRHEPQWLRLPSNKNNRSHICNSNRRYISSLMLSLFCRCFAYHIVIVWMWCSCLYAPIFAIQFIMWIIKLMLK